MISWHVLARLRQLLVDYHLSVGQMAGISEARTVLTLNVFLLNCRKLFVGGLDWSTTQGRWGGQPDAERLSPATTFGGRVFFFF